MPKGQVLAEILTKTKRQKWQRIEEKRTSRPHNPYTFKDPFFGPCEIFFAADRIVKPVLVVFPQIERRVRKDRINGY